MQINHNLQAQSHIRLCDSMDCSPQGLLSMGFPRQECCIGLPFPSPGDLPDSEIEPVSPALAGRFFTSELSEKTLITRQKKKKSRCEAEKTAVKTTVTYIPKCSVLRQQANNVFKHIVDSGVQHRFEDHRCHAIVVSSIPRY